MVYAVDIDNSTAAYRFRIYANGSELTEWGSDDRSSMSGDKAFNKAGGDSYIGDAYNSNQDDIEVVCIPWLLDKLFVLRFLPIIFEDNVDFPAPELPTKRTHLFFK